ncbi:hypothetical protein A3A14_04595 [Candidatus Daviesbacteria bacterium RIFCSPLOWO2_01_FULL_43_38]|uniref:Methyltransferase type 11 domain-containing protein n=2 Tax=Candidatus Daviesiibacteriota TaxID=1752718 RepID=A0A1F5K0M8_9BACT|nr:MAG: hypothetical protein UV33_C0004G0009 [Candidatus Daviesbacteria bacterium GW2011_GWA1_42_6]OGE34300.1 MAG: hypothetical protein A3E45_04940 [Candidatus Daviesbacteria bacterium RIFCSPHIGHO2_12_FULL_43_11]OGE63810.1 MAG: hypothetical protein A3A14_04595 [Candidatus Daviesbacteria bacterium RIFCSPLOWO2_01_FULL_43_38]OGE69107.1 MAG: hypothetical protein A3J21_00645 [Candidatus Daviesbacteria bacterium RIFCSPLOWO2_02_FULL_43_11]
MSKKLTEIHENVSPDHYDTGIKNNIFQRVWHFTRFRALSKMTEPVDGTILDIGCHSGLCTEKIMSWTHPREVYGIDISPKAIEKAKRRIKAGKFVIGDAQDLPYEGDFFDAIFCLEMLEHVDFPEQVLSQIHRVVKKGKCALILIPTDNLLFRTIWFLWNIRHPVWKHVHVQSFKEEVLEKMAEEAGFKVERVEKFNFGMLKIVKLIKP